MKKSVDFFIECWYSIPCRRAREFGRQEKTLSGCGSAWLERLVWDQEVAGSNPVTPTVSQKEMLFMRV